MSGIDEAALLALIRPFAGAMERFGLCYEGRVMLLQSLLAQEVCTLPPSERRPELGRIMGEMPMILRASEEGMHEAIIQNARDEESP